MNAPAVKADLIEALQADAYVWHLTPFQLAKIMSITGHLHQHSKRFCRQKSEHCLAGPNGQPPTSQEDAARYESMSQKMLSGTSCLRPDADPNKVGGQMPAL